MAVSTAKVSGAGTPEVQDAKHPASKLAGPYGHPLHPILVTAPIGLWIGSFAFDIVSRISSESFVFTRGAYWLILLGILGALAAAVFGLLDLLTIPRGTPAFKTGLTHMTLNLVVVAAFAVNFGWRFSGRDKIIGPKSTSVGQMILSGAALAILAVSGWLGGKLSYRYGVRVVDEDTRHEGLVNVAEAPGHNGHAQTSSDATVVDKVPSGRA